ncbi:alkaline phosphatase family protein [candidate division KSB1 bacterium]|nr:alkaline phosphatase family protein [candidate division KSB1 bacterium]
MSRVVLIFIDGLGIGNNDPLINPCSNKECRILNNFLDSACQSKPFDGIVLPLDASLGVPGLPQSATGQTALLTGVNAAQLLNRHLQGFPNQTLREIIRRESLLKKLSDRGKRVAFINAYPPIYFRLGPEKLQRHLSVTSIATLAADFKFFNFDDVLHGRSIYQEFTNRTLQDKYPNLPIFTPQKAGSILASASRRFDFSLYEYFQTDRAGHSQNMELAYTEIMKLEQFIEAFFKGTDLSGTTVILTSDHGNIEDLSVRSHTMNPAMTVIWGEGKAQIASRLKTILDITPVILDYFAGKI